MPPENRLDPNVYLAVERTFLAWIRTGLALMGFGFVVARFGLFLRSVEANARPLPGGVSLRFGTALVAMGAVLCVMAVVRYLRLLTRLRSGKELVRGSHLAVALGIALAVAGTLVTIYLLVAE